MRPRLPASSSLHRALVTGVALAASAPALAQTATLETIVVTSAPEKADGPVDGIVASRSATGTKTDTPIEVTPQSISVVTSDQMQRQAAQSNAEALRYVPGISSETFGADPRADWIRSRGFQIPEYLDGLRLPRGVYAWSQTDPYLLERLEILKGPASTLYGQTPPGGLVNMISKRPTDTPVREIQLQTGYPKRGQVAFDLGGPIDEAGVFSYRLTGLGRLGDTQVDHVNDDRGEIAGGVTWRPTDATSLTVLGHLINKDSKSLQFLPSSGTAKDNPNGRIARDRFIGEPDFDDFDFTQSGIGYLFEHNFASDITFRQNLRYGLIDYDLDVVRVHPAFGMRANNRDVARIAARIQDATRALTVDTNLSGHLATGALRHDWLVGLDYLNQDTDYSFARGAVADLDVYNPSYGATVGPLTTSTDQKQKLDQIGVYAQDQMTWQNLHVVLSGRYDWSDASTRNRLNGTVSETTDGQFTGRAGALYDFGGIAPYVSYATSFEPQTGTDASGNAFDPTLGSQIEAGVKIKPGPLNGLITLSAYQLTQDNLVVTNAGTSLREQVGQARVRGLEAEAKFDLAENWEIIASYAYQQSEISKATDGTEGNRLPYVPVHQASAWVNYTFSENAFDGLSLGGGVRYTGASYGDTRNQVKTDSYTLLDASLGYDFGAADPKLEGLTLAANVSNLLDTDYVASCNNDNSCYWGAGRSIRGTLTYRW